MAVAAAIEPATGGFARGCFQGADPAQGGKGGLAVQSVGVIASGDEQGGGGVGTDAVVGQQGWAVRGDRVGDPLDEVVDLFVSSRMRRASKCKV